MQLGNKADSLKKLSEFGFQVPGFQVVGLEVFREFRTKKNRTGLVAEWLDSKIKIESGKTYAVRSSGNKEDSDNASFAGLFTTYLDVTGKKNVVDAILQCWDAIDSDRVKAYCQQKDIDPSALEMSVIIQEFVSGDFSGVVFTMNPQNGHDDEVVVELAVGGGEKLVSGQVNPDTFEIKIQGNNYSVVSERKGQNVFSSNDQRDVFFRDLVTKVKEIQKNFKAPQDIEFTVRKGQIYFLQSRPITFFNYSNYEDVWTTADFRDGGVSSAVVSPIMWSLYGNVFKFSMESYFRSLGLLGSFPKERLQWYRVLFARPYWNAELVKQVQLQLPGFREDTFDQDLSIPKVYEGQGRVSGWSLGKIVKAVPVLLKIYFGFKNQERVARSWIERFPDVEKKWRDVKWSDLTDSELILKSRELYDEHFRLECDYFTTIYNASNAKMFFVESLTSLQKKVTNLNYIELIKSTSAMSVLNPLNSLQEIVQTIQADAEFLREVQESIANVKDAKTAETFHKKVIKLNSLVAAPLTSFFETYYYHSTKELDLRVPRWSEDKSFFYQTLRSSLSVTKLTRPKLTEGSVLANPSIENAEAHFSKSLFAKVFYRNTFFSRLERLKKFLWLREEVRDRSTRMYFFIRQWLLFLNRKYLAGDLLFYLPIEDVFLFLESPNDRSDILDKARETKSYAFGFENFKNPNEVGLKQTIVTRSEDSLNADVLVGLPCSPGRVQGIVRVLKTIQESQYLRPGEIMVVPFTDPGWTPLFGLAAGVITETGGLLSHAALIAREYSIPAVLNIPDATEKLKTGMKIELDGTSGRILILKDV